MILCVSIILSWLWVRLGIGVWETMLKLPNNFSFRLNRQGAKGAKGVLLLVHFDPGGGIQDQNTQALTRD
jgi:hypothetical protein